MNAMLSIREQIKRLRNIALTSSSPIDRIMFDDRNRMLDVMAEATEGLAELAADDCKHCRSDVAANRLIRRIADVLEAPPNAR